MTSHHAYGLKEVKNVLNLEERASSATQLISMTEYSGDGYQWHVELLVEQQTMTLLLNESDAVNGFTVKGTTSNDVRAFSCLLYTSDAADE